MGRSVSFRPPEGQGSPAGRTRGKGTAMSQTEVAIEGQRFLLNGRPTYAGRTWRGHPVEGLLMNSRMVQATFDDENPLTAPMWAYPDTGRWDAERNCAEFVGHAPPLPGPRPAGGDPQPARGLPHGLLPRRAPGRDPGPPLSRVPAEAASPAAGAPGARPAVAQQRPGRRGRAEGELPGAPGGDPGGPGPAGDGGHPGRLLLRAGRAPAGRGGRAPGRCRTTVQLGAASGASPTSCWR